MVVQDNCQVELTGHPFDADSEVSASSSSCHIHGSAGRSHERRMT